MRKERGVIRAILRATRPEGMTVSERKRRDRLLLLAVLAGWLVVLFEAAVFSYIYGDRHSGVSEVAAVATLSVLFYFSPMLLAVLPFFVLYSRATSKAAKVFAIAAGSLLVPLLFPLAFSFGEAFFGHSDALRRDAIEMILSALGFGVLPALTVFLVISRSEFFRRGKGDGGADVPAAVSAPLVDRTTTSGEVEFSTPRIVPA
jgi:hypothetical protein